MKIKIDDDEDHECSAFVLFNEACLKLADVSYNVRKMKPRKSDHGVEYLYENFVYSRMLWGKCE